jgi:hypothetical protein
MFRFRLSEDDREKYGGPEWVEFDIARAVELPVEVLEEMEEATGYTFLVELPRALERGSLKAVRAALWLARRIAGLHEPAFAQFTPQMLRADVEWVDPADADPPAPANRAARRARPSSSPAKGTGRRTSRATKSGT